MCIAVLEVAHPHQGLQADGVAAVGPVAGSARQVLGVDGGNDGIEDFATHTKVAAQHTEIVLEGVAHQDHGAVAEVGLGVVDRPLEDRV